MAWRFAGRSESRIDDVVLESARRWGIETAARYNRLIFAALEAIGDSPRCPATARSPASKVCVCCTSVTPDAWSRGSSKSGSHGTWSSIGWLPTAPSKSLGWFTTVSFSTAPHGVRSAKRTAD